MPKESGPVALAVDPAEDGPVWIALQLAGALARLDPASGAIDQVPLGAGSAPNSVILGRDGTPWIVDSGRNAILKVDPRTRAVQVWPVPDAAGYVELNAAAFDGDGRIWFTGQTGIYGRLDPSTGDIDLWDAPGEAGPASIVSTPSGRLAYLSLSGRHVGSIDPTTGAVETIAPPSPWQGPRRLAVDRRGNLYVTEWNVGRLSRRDATSTSWKTWPLPGPGSRGFAVHADEDAVWISDWGANALLRFDPKTERFQAFGFSQPNANVRQIAGRQDEIWVAESGSDKVVRRRFK
jgi:virginiamycin B lyase